eukprot:TRINITY_DN875_c0_g1_i2.p1 TRINITY_DN875_c0_g1~~TRINITY_DN875_c0_g1_i2.p1  ORF type:complete len:171 (-),score=30.44 TRINITY_DN875_c0_g1_i2:61-573(-)
MYLKENANAAAQRYISLFGDMRHAAGVKQKFNCLKAEMLKRILELGDNKRDEGEEEIDDSPKEALKFMKPYTLDFKGEKLFYLIDKKQYSKVTAGWLGNRMRFTLAKAKMSPMSEALREGEITHTSSAIIHLEAPSHYFIQGHYEDENYKGFELRLEDMRMRNKGQWDER